MRTFVVCLFLVGTLLRTPASAGSIKQLTVVLQFEGTPSVASVAGLDAELRSILSTSDVPLHINIQTEPLKGVVDGDLVVFHMKGACSLAALPLAALSDERGPLAMTHIVNGEILPFADVECDRVRRSVEQIWGRGNPHARESQYGAALARVLAHEVYHMLSHSIAHQSAGITKEALSSKELSGGTLSLSALARQAIRQTVSVGR